MATPQYLDLAGYKSHTAIRPEAVDEVESKRPGYIVTCLIANQAKIDARLRKRYAVPFQAPQPEIVLRWVVALTDPDTWLARGTSPNDPVIARYDERMTTALDEIKEAADSNTGLYDLPLAETTQATAVVSGGPLGYSEQSPYVAFDRQSSLARAEDSNQDGTGDVD